MTNHHKIDHIVYAVPDLEEAINWFEEVSGIRPVFGGYHANQGTKNALVNLGEGCYLELITIDEENTKITAPRWMGVDLLTTPKVTRWCLKSDNLAKDSTVVRKYNSSMGEIHKGQRKTTSGKLLSWQMILPLAAPEVELIPFMTDWQTSHFHPTDQLPEQCRLLEVKLGHPRPEKIQPTFDALRLQLNISQNDEPFIKIILDSPKGVFEI